MKLIQQLITRRTTAVEQLPPDIKRLVLADPLAGRTVDENRAFARLEEQVLPAPEWEGLRERLYARVLPAKEKQMTVISRLFLNKPWHLRLGFTVLLALALAALALLLPLRNGFQPGTPAWADTPGYKLTLDIPMSGSKDCDSPELQAFNKTLQAWVEEIDTAGKAAKGKGGAKHEIKLKLLVQCSKEGQPGPAKLIVMIAGATGEQVERLRQAIADTPGLSEPVVEEANWLAGGQLEGPGKLAKLDEDMLFIDIPKNATDDEIREKVLQWLKETHPDMKAKVEVSQTETTGPDGKPRREIKIKLIPVEE